MAEKKVINIRLLVDKKKNKVVFAESDKDFVDILFSFLTLPIGNKESNLGCMDGLYKSVEALDIQYLQTEACKEMLLRPESEAEAKCKSLGLNFIDDVNVPEYYICQTFTCTTKTHCLFSMFKDVNCLCGLKMNLLCNVGEEMIEEDRCTGTFVNGIQKFTITDDLVVSGLSTDTSYSVFRKFGIKDGTALEERILSIGVEEVLDLLKWSVLSKTPMTDALLLKQKEMNTKKIKIEPLDIKSQSQSDTKQVNLNLLIQKSRNKVLYAVAKADFLDLLFSFLTFPLGSIVELFGGFSLVGSMDKLYKSVESLCSVEPNMFMKFKDMLLHPKVAGQHGCKNQLLQIKEEISKVDIRKCSTCFEKKVYICSHGLDRVSIRNFMKQLQKQEEDLLRKTCCSWLRMS